MESHLLAACSRGTDAVRPCGDCSAGTGALAISVAVTSADVARVVASVTGSGIPTPLISELMFGGSPRAATGRIIDVPAGGPRTVTLSANPAASDPDGTIAIHRGRVQVTITAGPQASAAVQLLPVVGDVAVTAEFPAGDLDVARIHHTTVVVSGKRIATPATFDLQLQKAVDESALTAPAGPSGVRRGAVASGTLAGRCYRI